MKWSFLYLRVFADVGGLPKAWEVCVWHRNMVCSSQAISSSLSVCLTFVTTIICQGLWVCRCLCVGEEEVSARLSGMTRDDWLRKTHRYQDSHTSGKNLQKECTAHACYTMKARECLCHNTTPSSNAHLWGQNQHPGSSAELRCSYTSLQSGNLL